MEGLKGLLDLAGARELVLKIQHTSVEGHM